MILASIQLSHVTVSPILATGSALRLFLLHALSWMKDHQSISLL
jgi:hypothetical protein